MKQLKFLVLCIALIGVLAGCRGARSEKPPIHINPNLDFQAKFKAQTYSQTPPEGTIPWGTVYSNSKRPRSFFLKEDDAFYQGKTKTGAYVETIPIQVTPELMARGQERFMIYCSMCHDKAGTGQGPVIKRGFVPPPNFTDPRILAYKDGQFFDVITHGIRNMPSYKKQICEEDRWAIIAYVRALQKSRPPQTQVVSTNRSTQ